MEREYEWVENKVSYTTLVIGCVIFIIGFLSMIVVVLVSLFTKIDAMVGMVILLLSMPTALPFFIISSSTSTGEKYTTEFIIKCNKMLDDVKSKEDLIALQKYVYSQAVSDDNLIRLDSPESVQKLIVKINSQIEILNKIL